MEKIIFLYHTKKCYMNCGFCYAKTRACNKELTQKEIFDLAQICKKNKFTVFALTGGDPFQRTDLKKTLMNLKSLNYITRVDSNLIHYTEKKLISVSNYLDWLCIPLDGHNEQVHDSMRSKGHFIKTVNKIIEIKKICPDIKIKIHTVLTKKNYKSVMKMKKMITLINPKIWTIYKYFPAGVGEKNKVQFSISDKIYKQVKKAIGKSSKFLIDMPNDKIHDKTFLMVEANGTVYGRYDAKLKRYKTYGTYLEKGIEKALKEYSLKRMDKLYHTETGD